MASNGSLSALSGSVGIAGRIGTVHSLSLV